ncbi:hypothetical protein EDF78_102467 [Rahnella sp. BIGb0236]|uniref:hypothetical protein n=1 Tax=Rahnella sp. BIGb0236 TaxID=2485117 RepID=UPI000E6C0B2F|nr:hypothetical protein [Rahnella sp. BIGb0236]TDS96931.1 hypothetical protein EDF78_102467 [Rahnella sp. BIGb0236]VTQ53946.1 Protein of uncharacterised function (DUF3298) [Campylobacter jejuni]
MKLWIWLIAVLSLPALAEEPPLVYTGTLGKTSIVVELDLNKPDEVTGRYFYQKYRLDLPLNGTLDGQDLKLQEGLDDFDDTPRPELSLTKDENGGWQGSWTNPQGKTLPVTLKPAQLPATAADDGYLSSLIHTDPYEYLRLSALELKAGKSENFMGYQLQWWTEPQSKISFFEIISGYPEASLPAINQKLRARLWQEVSGWHACMLGASRFGQGEYRQTVTPEYLSTDVVSISVFTTYDCGGAHPDFGEAPVNLNAKTADTLTLEDVVWVGEGAPFHYLNTEDHALTGKNDVDFDTFAQYREKAWAPWLVKQLTAAYPQQMKKPTEESDDDCDYSDPSVWQFPAWYFTQKGLYFDPTFARVLRSCESPEWSVLPWSAMKGHAGSTAINMEH